MGDNFSVSFEFPSSLADVEIGTVACLNPDGTQYIPSTNANVVAGGIPSVLVMEITSSSGYARLIHAGDAPVSVSGLGAGPNSPVVVDLATGLLVRKASGLISAGDWFCGYADALGNVRFHKPFQFITGVSSILSVAIVTGDYTAAEIDRQVVIVNTDTPSGDPTLPFNITMPTGIVGREVIIKDGGNNAALRNIILAPTGIDQIEQFAASNVYAATLTISSSSSSFNTVFDGTNWRLI